MTRNDVSVQPTGDEPLLVAESVQKYYRNGEVSVHALVDLDLRGARGRAGRASWGRPGPARPRCSTACPGWTTSTPAASSSAAATCSR